MLYEPSKTSTRSPDAILTDLNGLTDTLTADATESVTSHTARDVTAEALGE